MSIWNVDSLFAHFTELRKADERAIQAALVSAREALHAALAANEKRLDGMNEFRQTLTDQTGTFVSRRELIGWIVAATAVGAFLGHYVR